MRTDELAVLHAAGVRVLAEHPAPEGDRAAVDAEERLIRALAAVEAERRARGAG